MQSYARIVQTVFAAALFFALNLAARVYAQAPDATSSHQIYLPVVLAQSNSEMAASNETVINGLDPKHVPSQEELEAMAVVDAQAQQHLQELLGEIHAAYLKPGRTLALEREWKEPEGKKFNNYCGPGATQVALDVRLPATSVKDIGTLAQDEFTNVGKTGTYLQDICPILNKYLNISQSTYKYIPAYAGSVSQFLTWTFNDIDATYALVTGVKTGPLPGWLGYNTTHIVSVIGYQNAYIETNGITSDIKYADTASKTAGYNGTFSTLLNSGTFWQAVSQNNIQCIR